MISLDKLIKKFKKGNMKDYTVNLVVFVFVCVAIVIGINTFTNNNDDSTYEAIKNINKASSENMITYDYSTLLERRLENILSQIKGVGKVSVMVTIEETIEKIPAKNLTKSSEKTNETDSEGGVREIIREDYNEQIIVNNNELAVIKSVNPKVTGVIVVADGVEDVSIKEQLYTALKTILGIAGNKVEVYCSK